MDLLKMDVEGQEFSLLSSAAEPHKRNRPTMFLEVLDNTPKLRSFNAELCAETDYGCFGPTAEHLAGSHRGTWIRVTHVDLRNTGPAADLRRRP